MAAPTTPSTAVASTSATYGSAYRASLWGVTGPAWTIDLVNGDHVLGSSSSHAALAGYPLLSVPSGLVSGLPVGITFSGTGRSDATLIRLAHAFETARIKADGPFPTPEFTQWV